MLTTKNIIRLFVLTSLVSACQKGKVAEPDAAKATPQTPAPVATPAAGTTQAAATTSQTVEAPKTENAAAEKQASEKTNTTNGQQSALEAIEAAVQNAGKAATGVEQKAWLDLIKLAKQRGDKRIIENRTMMTLSKEIKVEISGNSSIIYFSVVNTYDQDTSKFTSMIIGDSVDCSLQADKSVLCDQWQFAAELDGTLKKVVNKIVTLNEEQTPISSKETVVESEEGVKKWIRLKSLFYNSVVTASGDK